MRRRASSEGRVFVRQNLEKGQLTVDDTGFNAKRYSHSKVYDVGLRETVQEAARRRRKDLINNLHIAAWFFEKRFKVFFEKVLIPKWGLVDWWYRFEWQHHGNVHVHGIAKRESIGKT
ncbi:hypothetical protein RhiirC2_749620 [Rhizophagus irregularis]|uniref:Helitron helicase-like domain-containing protein n=1 Tax=Rhizophagus irregularis TaxID=588596 RepID=A0A2N1N4D3_9GLOM|nr:hypothetical protein RhiirC2_749620 [Rhizophagus irregularis]